MLTELRSQMKTIMWILVVAFLGTIVFSWGMGGFKDKTQAGIIGEINNQEILFEDFQYVVQRQIESEQRNAGAELDQTKIKRVREEAWDNYVESYLKAEDAKRLKIKPTNQEIAYVVKNQPPAEVRQSPMFQKDGQFDPVAYQNFLRTPDALQYLLGMEQSVKNYLVESNLYFQVIQTADVAEDEILDQYYQDHVTGKLQFLSILVADMTIDSSKITDEMMRKYYRSFPGKFKQNPMSQFAYVKLKLAPTLQDTIEIQQDAQDILTDLKNGVSFSELAKNYSQDINTATNGGDLDWITKGRMPSEFDEAVFTAKTGDIVGPIQTRQGLHVVKVDGQRKNDEGEPEVKASQILLKIEASSDTKDDTYNEAFNFSQEIIERDFSEVANEMSYAIDTTKEFSEAGYIAGLGRMRMAAQFCFNNPVGTVSAVYPVPDGYVIFKITSKTEEGTKPFEKVEKTVRKQLEKVIKKNKAWDLATNLRSKINSLDDLQNVAVKNEMTLHVTSDSLAPNGTLPDGLSADRNFIKEAFQIQAGHISQVIEGKKGYYISYLENKNGFVSSEYTALHESIYEGLVSRKRDAIARNWVRELRIAADMKDYRFKYYRDF